MENGQSACMLSTLQLLKHIRKMTKKGQKRKKGAKRYDLFFSLTAGSHISVLLWFIVWLMHFDDWVDEKYQAQLHKVK